MSLRSPGRKENSVHCHAKCLHAPSVNIALTTIESPESKVQMTIPSEYQEFNEMFSKTKASGLPPHIAYDCALELLAGATAPHDWIYPLSAKETQDMEAYIEEAQ